MRAFLSKQFLLFLVSGGTAASVNFLSRILYNQWMSFSSAVILSYLTGMIVAFILMRGFVFRNKQRATKHSLWIFVLVNLTGIIQVWGVSIFLDQYFFPWINMDFHPKATAHMIGIIIPAFTSYLAHKYWSFKET